VKLEKNILHVGIRKSRLGFERHSETGWPDLPILGGYIQKQGDQIGRFLRDIQKQGDQIGRLFFSWVGFSLKISAIFVEKVFFFILQNCFLHTVFSKTFLVALLGCLRQSWHKILTHHDAHWRTLWAANHAYLCYFLLALCWSQSYDFSIYSYMITTALSYKLQAISYKLIAIQAISYIRF
jgi:hypothetical protein